MNVSGMGVIAPDDVGGPVSGVGSGSPVGGGGGGNYTGSESPSDSAVVPVSYGQSGPGVGDPGGNP